ncbi:hypothetical protein JCM11491_006552 [Sporobolomyces phaffii]
MTTPAELSEAHLQDHELISAALEASSSVSPRLSSSSVTPFANPAPERLATTHEALRDASNSVPAASPDSPDLLTTPRTDSSRPLSSPPQVAQIPSPAALDSRNTVKFSVLARDTASAPEDETSTAKKEDRPASLQGRLQGLSIKDGEPSADTKDEEAESNGLALDPVLFAALNHPRDRFLLLRAEVELERFLANTNMTRLPLAPPYFQPALNSYQRLLVHRLADTFGITREVEAAPPTVWNAGAINPATGQPQGVVVLVKGENTRPPPAKLATYAPAPEIAPPLLPSSIVVPSPSSTPSIASSPVTSAGPSASTSSLPNLVDSSSAPSQLAATPQILKILPRSSASRTASSASSSIGTDEDPATSSSAPASAKGKGRRELTLEEREAAYKEARERIFSQPEQERTAPAVPSSSSVASEDIGSRLALAGAGITRPSSAGSTFSRSSAALSVAGGRPSPSVASESGSSMWSGPHGGIYGGGSQLMPSLRPSAPSFDPSLAEAGWTPELSGQYPPDPSWQHQQQYQHYPHPPIQVTAPPAHSPYSAPSPSYAPPAPSFAPGSIQAPPAAFPSSQPPSYAQQIDGWNRNFPPPLPSPSLSNSSSSSMQRPSSQYHPESSAPPSERSTSASSGYLMRFADTGAVVSPGGTVSPGPAPSFPSPSSSVFVGPPSTTRSVSSFSSTSQQSLSSGGTSRTAASSSAGGGGGGSGGRVGTSSQPRRPSGSLASSVSSARSGGGSGERRVSITADSEGGALAESKKRDRQTTIRRQSPASSEIERGVDGPNQSGAHEDNSPLHPSLPAKPVWVATKSPRPRTPPPVAQPSSTKGAGQPSQQPSHAPPAHFPPPANAPQVGANSRPPQGGYPQYAASMNPAPPPQPSFFPQQQQRPPQAYPRTDPLPSSQVQQPNSALNWPRNGGMHYPAAPSFAPNSAPGQYPIGGGGYGSNASLPPANWGYTHHGHHNHATMPPAAPTAPPPFAVHSGSRAPPDAMPFADIRRPPPKSTQLFDPNRPSTVGGGGGSGMRRGVSGSGSARSASGTRANLA